MLYLNGCSISPIHLCQSTWAKSRKSDCQCCMMVLRRRRRRRRKKEGPFDKALFNEAERSWPFPSFSCHHATMPSQLKSRNSTVARISRDCCVTVFWSLFLFRCLFLCLIDCCIFGRVGPQFCSLSVANHCEATNTNHSLVSTSKDIGM